MPWLRLPARSRVQRCLTTLAKDYGLATLLQQRRCHEPAAMPAPSDAGIHRDSVTDGSDVEVSLLNMPVAVNWHMSKRALPRQQRPIQPSHSDTTDDEVWLLDDLLSDDDSNLAC